MRQLSQLIGTLVLLFFFNAGITAELSGHVGLEARYFAHAPLFTGQKRHNASINIETEIAHQWDDGRQILVVTPFARLDNADKKRSHFDIRELLWTKVADQWELQVGIGKVFWGVTESQHNDLMAGMRLVLNDIQSSEILFGGIFDLDDEAALYTLEGSRRLGEAWKLTVEARIFSNITKTTDPLYSLRSDDHVLVDLAWFF